MAWSRSRRSPYQGGMIVSGVMAASWASSRGPPGGGGAGEGERAAARGGGDDVAAVVHRGVVAPAQADQVAQVGPAAVGPVHDVVQVGAAGTPTGDPVGVSAETPAAGP